MDSHPTDKSEDTLESGHQVRTWFSDSGGVLHFCGNPCGNTWKSPGMGKAMAKRESNRCVGMLLLGKKCHVHPRPDDILFLVYLEMMIQIFMHNL